jgi:prepilin-type processing-associated H-X9-DG protein
VSTSEIEDTSGTIYLAEHPHSNNDLGGNLKNYNNNPASILEYDAKNTNLTTLGRLGLHDGYTSFNFLFTDGHSVNHLLSETATGAIDKNANGMWSRQAGD